MDGVWRTTMLTKYYEPLFSTAFDLFPENIWASSSNRSDTIDKNGIKVELPGVKSSDLEVTVEGKNLLVRGKTRHGKTFNYTYTISSKVNVEGITAKFIDGLLEVDLPRKEAAIQTRKIEIQT